MILITEFKKGEKISEYIIEINEWQFILSRSKIFENNFDFYFRYDLQGILLKDTAISWAPDYVARDCNSEGIYPGSNTTRVKRELVYLSFK